MKISVLTVNYNTGDLISKCIDSVLKQVRCDFEMIVVDNASADYSVDVLSQYGEKIKFIESTANLGFGKANNLAAQNATGELLFLLNPDAYLEKDNVLEEIIRFMQSHSEYGCVGTRIVNLAGNDETLPKQHHTGEKIFSYPFDNLKGSIAWVIGASVVIPKTIFEQIGGFDENFFLYGEDEDLCLRIRKLGYEIGYAPDIVVTHLDAGSERKTKPYDLIVKKQRALIQFYKKYFKPDDVIYLLRRENRRALWRMFWHKILGGDFERYRAIYDTNKNYLKS